MFPIKLVLCPTDFSDPSSEALKIAAELASKVGAELLLVHVVPVLPALPSDPNYVFKVPEYERLLHQDADEKLAHLVGGNGESRNPDPNHGWARRCGERDCARRRVGESRSDRDCHPRGNRLATVRVWFRCRESGAPRQVSRAHDTQPAGGESLATSGIPKFGRRAQVLPHRLSRDDRRAVVIT